LAPASVPAGLVWLVHQVVRMTLTLIEWMADCRWAVRPVTPLPLWATWLYYGSLFGILLVIRRRKNNEQGRSRLQRG
jgi:hypothetical protein